MLDEILDLQQILNFINTDRQKHLPTINIVETIPSTNSELLNAAKTLSAGTVLLAEEQTAGRGRQGKPWYSPKGLNLYCSLLWHLRSSSLLQSLALAVAMMLVKALEKFGINSGLQLKWPNDIYFENRKLAGILIESVTLEEDVYAVVIGFGMNTNRMHDFPYVKQAICIAEILNKTISRNALVGTLLDDLVAGLIQYEQQGFDPYLKAWKSYDMLCGKYVIVHSTQGDITGIALGINMKGELIVRNEYGKEIAFHSGEVSVMLG